MRYGGAFLALGLLCAGACASVIWRGATARPKARLPSPWMKRRDWAEGKIAAVQNASSALGLACVGALTGGVALFLFLSPGAAQIENGLKWVLAMLAIAFSTGAVYTAMFRQKFGKSFFRPSTVPGVIGGTLEGTFDVSVRFDAQPRLKLNSSVCDWRDGRAATIIPASRSCGAVPGWRQA